MFWRKKNKDKAAQTNTAAVEDAGASTIKVVVKTDLGNVRTNNEDAGSFFKVADENIIREKGYLLLVADGMGGHNAGEVASKMAVEIIHEEYFKPGGESSKEKLLSKAFNAANKKIFDLASANESYKGMGTTCTALVVIGKTIYYAHAGDSRAYLYKNKAITRLTEDHTYVQQLVKNGDITAAEANTHPQRNILTNAMGTKPALRVDTGAAATTFDEGDRLLLCSDGLYDYLNDDELATALRYESLQNAADYLVAEAKRRGGKDNITVVLAEKTATPNETALKLTRDVDMPKLTRDADLPSGI
jgi:protein phosphatase